MSNMHTRWFVGGLFLSALAATGCDVSVGECDKDDAGECVDLFPDEPDGSALDGSTRRDAGPDGAAPEGGSVSPEGGALDGGTPDANTGAPITLLQFCDQQLATANAWAGTFDKCCFSSLPSEASAFLTSVVLYVDDPAKCENARNIGVMPGDGGTPTVTYDGTKAAACAADFVKAFASPGAECPLSGFDLRMLESTIGHGAPALSQVASCREAFKGSIKQGMPCVDPMSCASGLRCVGEAGNKTCQNTVPSGGTCFADGECADGLTCVGSAASGGKQCRTPAPSTAKCERSKECETGLVCANGACATATASTPVCK